MRLCRFTQIIYLFQSKLLLELCTCSFLCSAYFCPAENGKNRDLKHF